jgi:hypothetical protein
MAPETAPAWREVVWSGAGVVTHKASRDVPVAIIFRRGTRISDLVVEHSNHWEFDDLLFLLCIQSKLREHVVRAGSCQ